MSKDIMVGKIPLSAGFSEVNQYRQKDDELKRGIIKFEKEHLNGDYEIFLQEDNILVTSESHFVALHEDQVNTDG